MVSVYPTDHVVTVVLLQRILLCDMVVFSSSHALTLTLQVPVALVMQGLVDVGRMACEGQPIQPTSTNQKTIFAPGNLSLMHFTQENQRSSERFMCQNFRTNYNVAPYGDNGTERVNHSSLFQHYLCQTCNFIHDLSCV